MRTFADGATEPTEADLETQLGQTWSSWKAILQTAAEFKPEWTFSNASGWMLKVHDGQKALMYLIPIRGAFTISMAIRESEHGALLADGALGDAVHEQLEGARQYAEGFALKFEVWAIEDMLTLQPFLHALVKLRRGGAAGGAV
jgi:hypothetical protein